MGCQSIGECHDDREDHCRRTDDCSSDQHRLSCRFECVAGAVVLFKEVFGASEVYVDVEISLNFLFDVRDLFDQRQLIN